MKHRLFLLLTAVFLLAPPLSAQRQKVTEEERAQAIMRVYDLLESRHWVMLIDNITTTSVSYSQLITDNNYILVADSLMTIQIDVAGANRQTNLTASQKQQAAGMAYWHPDVLEAGRGANRDYCNIDRTETTTNRRGTQIVHKMYLSTPDYPQSGKFNRMIIDPITMKADFGVYSGRLVPADEALLNDHQPRRTDEQLRTIEKARGTYQKQKATVDFKVIAGYDYCYKIGSIHIPEAIDKVADTQASSFQVGVGLDCHVDNWAQGLTLQAALTYSPLRISDDNPIYLRATKPEGSGTQWQKKPWTCRGDLLNLSFGGQYTFGQGRIRPLVRAGVVVRYFVNNVVKNTVDFNGMYRVTEDRFYFNFNNGLQPSAYVGTGCLFDLGRHTLGLHADASLDRVGASVEFSF